jgi:hypothetical protein
MATAAPAARYANWTSRGATVKAVNAEIAKLQYAKRAYADTGMDAVTYVLDEIVGGLLRLVYLLQFDGQPRSPMKRSPKHMSAKRSQGKRSPVKRSPAKHK